MLKGKKILVTGSSRGIGKEIVKTFLGNGATVWGLCSKPSASKEELENFAKENGTTFTEICADVGNAEQVTAVVKEALASSGGFDVLVNNAGITKDMLLMRMKKEDFESVVDTNLVGTFNVTRNVIGAMTKARCGRIINVSSVVGVAGPGDSLANEETFEFFEKMAEKHPDLIKCMSTNGLLLPKYADRLAELGVNSVTVTINAIEPDIAVDIYSFIKYEGKVYKDYDAVNESMYFDNLEDVQQYAISLLGTNAESTMSGSDVFADFDAYNIFYISYLRNIKKPPSANSLVSTSTMVWLIISLTSSLS